jgi:hypothetical protein
VLFHSTQTRSPRHPTEPRSCPRHRVRFLRQQVRLRCRVARNAAKMVANPKGIRMSERGRVVAMPHPQFVQLWKADKLIVDVNRLTRGAADAFALPKRYRAARIFFTCLWMLSFPAAFAVMHFYADWAGALILLIVPRTLFLFANEANRRLLIKYALENPEFYAAAVERGFFRVQRTPMWD